MPNTSPSQSAQGEGLKAAALRFLLPTHGSWEDRLRVNMSLMRGEPLGAPTGGRHPWQAPAQAAAHGPVEPGAKAPQAEGKETVAGMGGLGPRAAPRPPRPGGRGLLRPQAEDEQRGPGQYQQQPLLVLRVADLTVGPVPARLLSWRKAASIQKRRA